MDRRTLIGLGAALFSGLPRLAEASPVASALSGASDVLPLWPSGPPGGALPALRPRSAGAEDDRILTGVLTPSLSIVMPAKPDGSALLVVPGGGYMQLTWDIEGAEIARRFADSGVTCFLLSYRLPNEGWSAGPLAPLQDAIRAMRLIRSTAAQHDIDPARIGAIGFSAGGHLVASLATRSNEPTYAAMDEVDRVDARPSFIGLGYPVITMLPPYAHEASREHLLGVAATDEQRTAWSVERAVTVDTPPAFLFAAADDPYVPVENTLAMFSALKVKKVAAEMHIFERGGHGFGLRALAPSTTSLWPSLFSEWARMHGMFGGPVVAG